MRVGSLPLPLRVGMLLVLCLLSGCSDPAQVPLPPTETIGLVAQAIATALPSPTALPPTETPLPTPTALPPTPTATATPLPTAVPQRYKVKSGDTLLAVALAHDLSLEELLKLNNITADAMIKVGSLLIVPSAISINLPQAYLIHDTEVVYGRSYLDWDTAGYIQSKGGYLALHREGETPAADIIESVAKKHRIGPRVLLALMELQSQWVTNPAPPTSSPFGIPGGTDPNLWWQATWTAQKLAGAYYGQLEGRRDWVTLENGQPARLYPGTNAGTAAVAAVLAALRAPDDFTTLLSSQAFQDTYRRLFGERDGGQVMPPDGAQPYLELPFPEEELWYFTGGPHGGFGDDISGWAALDFAPPIPAGCWTSIFPVRAVSTGLVVKSEDGEVWVDLDEDGDLRTGWVVFYLHIDSERRVPAGTRLAVGDRVGYPSCEGGVSVASHLHIARLYDNQWMPARGPIPFQLGRWTATRTYGDSYEGYMASTLGMTLESCDCRVPKRNRFPERPWYRGP